MESEVTIRDLQVQIKEFYEELGLYSTPARMDLLSQGVGKFLEEIDKLREWGDRILAMKRQVSTWRSAVRPIAVSKVRYWERMVAEELVRMEAPKKLTAKERRCLAESKYQHLEDELRWWQELDKRLLDLSQDLTDKYKHLVDSKKDLRTNLMSLRMQLVLDRAGTNFAELLTDHGLKKVSRHLEQCRSSGSDPEGIGGPHDPLLAMDPKELDNLLEGEG